MLPKRNAWESVTLFGTMNELCACGCGRPLLSRGTGSPTRFASDACKQRAYRRRQLRLPEYNPPAWKTEVSIPYGRRRRPSREQRVKFESFMASAANLSLAGEVDVRWGGREVLVWVFNQARDPDSARAVAVVQAKRWALESGIATDAELDAYMAVLTEPRGVQATRLEHEDTVPDLRHPILNVVAMPGGWTTSTVAAELARRGLVDARAIRAVWATLSDLQQEGFLGVGPDKQWFVARPLPCADDTRPLNQPVVDGGGQPAPLAGGPTLPKGAGA